MLESVEIAETVTRIGKNAFSGCTALTSVVFKNTDGWTTIRDLTDIYGSPVEVDDAVANANKLVGTHCDCEWRRG